jgi:hypothetical protein
MRVGMRGVLTTLLDHNHGPQSFMPQQAGRVNDAVNALAQLAVPVVVAAGNSNEVRACVMLC